MAYARWGEGDVYVLRLSSRPQVITCMACILSPEKKYDFDGNAAQMFAHMQQHIAAGHDVPGSCIRRLMNEAAEEKSEAMKLHEKGI